MVSQIQAGLATSPGSNLLRHPLLQTLEGTVQVFTAPHRSFFTAVMVQALRTADQGRSVLIAQFLKGGIDQGPERPMQLGPNLDWLRCAMTHCIHGFERTAPNQSPDASATQTAVSQLWVHVQQEVAKGRYGLIVLDELSLAVAYGLIAEAEVIEFIRQRPPQVDVVLTGPHMPESLLTLADQVTQCRRSFLT